MQNTSNNFKVIAVPVAGKYQGRLVVEDVRDAQLNRFSKTKPQVHSIATTGKTLYATAEAAETAMAMLAVPYIKAITRQ